MISKYYLIWKTKEIGKNQVWTLNFLSGINCILLHWNETYFSCLMSFQCALPLTYRVRLTSLSVYCPARSCKTQSVNGSIVLKRGGWVHLMHIYSWHRHILWPFCVVNCNITHQSMQGFQRKFVMLWLMRPIFLISFSFDRDLALN